MQGNTMKLIHAFPFAAALLLTSVAAQTADPAGIRIPTVQVGTTATGTSLELDAVLEPVRQATVTAQVGGNVLALKVAAGDTVRRGQPLVHLDDREVRANTARSDAAVTQAQAELRNVQQVLDRNRELKKNGFLSAAALDSAENQVKSAQAALAQAQAARAQASVAQGFAELVAPFDAVVLTTHVQTGDLALPGRALVTIYQPGLLRAVAQVPASRVAQISAASDVAVVLPDGQRLVPTDKDMQPTADPVSQTVEWRLPLPASAAGLRPGQMVRVQATGTSPAAGAATAGRLSVPARAILHRGELTAVYVAADKGFLLRAVRVGTTGGDMVDVVTGLRAGERVALDPVRAGMPGAIAE
jgi:RND family efflux transporter MFP subunit